jgi:hypothetical protein
MYTKRAQKVWLPILVHTSFKNGSKPSYSRAQLRAWAKRGGGRPASLDALALARLGKLLAKGKSQAEWCQASQRFRPNHWPGHGARECSTATCNQEPGAVESSTILSRVWRCKCNPMPLRLRLVALL